MWLSINIGLKKLSIIGSVLGLIVSLMFPFIVDSSTLFFIWTFLSWGILGLYIETMLKIQEEYFKTIMKNLLFNGILISKKLFINMHLLIVYVSLYFISI